MTAVEFVVIGYVLIEGKARMEYMHSSVPQIVFTPTTCVCTIHPSPEAMTWVKNRSNYLAALGFDDNQLVEYYAEVDALFDKKLWGFDSVFANLDVARNFQDKWFSSMQDIRLFEIAIPESLLTDFTKVVAPPESNAAQNGSYFASLLPKITSLESEQGYEIIGVTSWSDMHTSICYDVREEFVKSANAKFNILGFFESFETAHSAAYANNNQTDGGTVGEAQWFPVKISCLSAMMS